VRLTRKSRSEFILTHGFGVRPPQDFVDINCGCPIDLVYKTGAGSGLMERTGRLRHIVTGMSRVMDCPITVKMRVGVYKDPTKWNAAQLAAKVSSWPRCWNFYTSAHLMTAIFCIHHVRETKRQAFKA
jgi:hypothetical protein